MVVEGMGSAHGARVQSRVRHGRWVDEYGVVQLGTGVVARGTMASGGWCGRST